MVQQRSIAVAIILTIITCGIYGLYWFVCLTDEANQLTKGDDTSGGMALIFTLITCGLYGYYWSYKMGEKVDELKNQRGLSSSSTGILYLILSLFGFQIVAYALIQDEINKNA